MKVSVRKITDFSLVANAARNTVNKPPLEKEFSDKFKLSMYLSEHSPIRNLLFEVIMTDIPYYASVHFSRHKIGVDHFVTTQRTDRTGIDRDKKMQDSPVTHMMIINAQALINMSRKRLCNNADGMTQAIMREIKKCVSECEPLLAKCMVVDCIYRGGCFEIQTCGYDKTDHYAKENVAYDGLVKEIR